MCLVFQIDNLTCPQSFPAFPNFYFLFSWLFVCTVSCFKLFGGLHRSFSSFNFDFAVSLFNLFGGLHLGDSPQTYTPGEAYILKAKKFAEPPFQLKKIAEKVRVIFGPFREFF